MPPATACTPRRRRRRWRATGSSPRARRASTTRSSCSPTRRRPPTSPTSASSSRTAPRSTRTYNLTAQSRLTVYAGSIPELVNQSFGAQVTFTIAGAAERAMYFGTPTFSGGHESAGVTRPSTNWFLAEGATGSFFTTFVLLSNPNATPAAVTLTYLREGGGTVTTPEDDPGRYAARPSTSPSRTRRLPPPAWRRG